MREGMDLGVELVIKAVIPPHILMLSHLMMMERLVHVGCMSADKPRVQHCQLTPNDDARVVHDLADLRV